MATYNYSNGNFTSTTNIGNNGVIYTQNITNLGSGCGDGTNYCNDGYSLYFPCLKNITRGESVCFDFYIADNSTKDVVDLRDVDAITIELSGRFGCVYGDYSYPDDIFSLQREDYSYAVFEETFDGENIYTLNVVPVSLDFEEYDGYSVKGRVGKYYSGDEVILRAYDTKDKIFVGWGDASILENDDIDSCSLTFDDIKIEPNRRNGYELSEGGYQLKFNISKDTYIFAVYRDRAEYSLTIDWDNSEGLEYIVWYDGKKYELTDVKNTQLSNDGNTIDSVVTVLEGHKFQISAVPYPYTDIDKSDIDDSDEKLYKGGFLCWNDYVVNMTRVFTMDRNMSLYAFIDKDISVSDVEIPSYEEVWESHRLEEHSIDSKSIDAGSYNENIYIDNGIIEYGDGFGHLIIGPDSKVILMGISDEYGIKMVIDASSDSSDSDISVITASCGEEGPYTVDVGQKNEYSFFFRRGGDIIISSSEEVVIDRITIYREDIIDKGLCQLCVPGEDTLNFHRGPLYAGGVIMVNGKSYGLPVTMIGNINNLKKILM